MKVLHMKVLLKHEMNLSNLVHRQLQPLRK
jgi:hypothetical protein